MTALSYDRTNVFISYSHKDAQYLEQLKMHLAFYKQHGSLTGPLATPNGTDQDRDGKS